MVALDSRRIRPDAITSEHVKDLEVKTGDIADLGVTTGKLAADAVTSAKIASSAVETDKLATGAVTKLKIGSGAVTAAKMSFKVVDVTVTAGGTSGSSAADALLVNGYIFGYYSSGNQDQFVDNVVLNADGSITITLAAAATADNTFKVVCMVL